SLLRPRPSVDPQADQRQSPYPCQDEISILDRHGDQKLRWGRQLHSELAAQQREFWYYDGNQIGDNQSCGSDQDRRVDKCRQNLFLNSGTDPLIGDVLIQNPGEISALF